MDIVVRTPDELVAVLAHVLGFEPEASLIVLPHGTDLPVARVDLPRTAQECASVLAALRHPSSSAAVEGGAVALIGVCEDGVLADRSTARIADGVRKLNLAVTMRLWSAHTRWVDLDSGMAGDRTRAAADRIAAEMVAAGSACPVASRKALARSLVGDRGPIGGLLRAPAATQGHRFLPGTELTWVTVRVRAFLADGRRLSDRDAARLLLGLQVVQVRDAVWTEMRRDNAVSHMALWSDLVRRAPDEVRTSAACLLAFASWLHGDGARAWCAMDQIPQEQASNPLASMVSGLLQRGVHPDAWARCLLRVEAEQCRGGPRAATTHPAPGEPLPGLVPPAGRPEPRR